MSEFRKQLSSRQSRLTIGLFTDNVDATFLEAQWQGVVDAAQDQDVNLVCYTGGVYRAPGLSAAANILYDLVDTKHLDGLIIWGGNMLWRSTPEEVSEFVRRCGSLPVVSCEMKADGVINLLLDDYHGMRQAVEHLIREHGRRRIVFLRGPESHLGARERYRAYCDALTAAGLELDQSLVSPEGPWISSKEDIHAVLEQLKLRPGIDYDGLVCVSCHMALTAIELLKQDGIQVPGQVSVAAFDDVLQNVINPPALTTVVSPFYEMGRLAVNTLVATLRGEDVGFTVVQPTRLAVRRSCGCFEPLVAQAAFGDPGKPASHIAPERAAASPSDHLDINRLKADQEAIAAEMANGIAAYASLQAQEGITLGRDAARLVEALAVELEGKAPGAFLIALEAIASQAVAGGGDVNALHAGLSTLRRQVIAYLDQPALGLVDGWVNQGRVLLSQAAERAQIGRVLRHEQVADAQRQVTARLVAASDISEMMDGLAETLPGLGIAGCYVSMYDDPSRPEEWSRLVLAYRPGERVVLEPFGRQFPTRQWIPVDLYPSRRRVTLLVQALYFQDRPLGFIIFEVNTTQGAVYEAVRQELSTSLYKLQQVQRELAERRQVENSLASEQHLLRVLMDNLPDQIYFKDAQSRFIRINETQSKHLGMSDPGQAVGKTDFDFFGEEHARPAYEDEQRIIQTGQPLINLEEKEVFPDGRVAWVSTTKMPLRDEKGEITGTFGISRDITARRQAEEDLAAERNLLRTLIDNIPLLVYVKDTQGRFLLVNQADADFLGSTPQAVIGKTDADFFPLDLAARYKADEQSILESGIPLVDHEEPTINQATGEVEAWNQTTKVPLHDADGKVIGLVGIGRDITEQKRSQMERERLLGDVERRALQLQTASEVSRAASSILEPAELIKEVVELIHDRFGLYYTGLFLVDQAGAWTGDPGRWVVLRAGTGEAGQQMLAQGHKLEIGETSMIGWCVLHKQARIALDVGKDAVRFRNPYLPDTRSELAMPLISRGEALGALTIQSERSAAFTEEDITIFKTMADQIANAIANARLYESAQTALQEIEATYRRYISQGWSSYTHTRASSGYRRSQVEGLTPIDNRFLPETRQAVTENKAITLSEEGHPTLVMPIKLREQPIGAMGFRAEDSNRQWTDEEITLIELLTEQFALAAENLRLFDETQRRAERERTIANITSRMRETLRFESILKTTVQEIQQALGLAEVVVSLKNPEGKPADEQPPLPSGNGDHPQPETEGE